MPAQMNTSNVWTDKLQAIDLHQLHRSAVYSHIESDSGHIAFLMATILLDEFFGREWLQRKILPSEVLKMLLSGAEDFIGESKIKNRTLMLAEGLYNLRNIIGFDNVIEKLAYDEIESALAEIESGRLFSHQGYNFEYINRTGQKGLDFDILMRHGNTYVHCETKRKIDSSKFSPNAFSNTLTKAKKQLPREGSSIILIKTPDSWENNENEMKETAQQFVNKTQRSIGVVCWREKWIRTCDAEYLKHMTGFETYNQLGNTELRSIIPVIPAQPINSNWTEFEKYADFCMRFTAQ